MVHGRSLDLCKMIFLICIISLCRNVAREKETHESLSQERERGMGDRTLMLKRNSPVISS